ncbi:MAG TPA: cytochrome c maturation protein CcmE [Acidimicrobiales bacterium]|nr:cytochrome c maturation protein CcmE [Acidimicrobiales bacterium]
MGELNADPTPVPDLTPRTGPAPRRRRRNVPALLAVGLVLAGLLVVVFNGLGDATLFFRNADEAVEQRAELVDRRFRLQGVVDGESIRSSPVGADFVVTYNGVDVTVAHQGDPPQLFQAGIPVVLEGSWIRVGDSDVPGPAADLPTDGGWYFASDRMLVKHTEVYIEDNPERVSDYGEGPLAEDPAVDPDEG